MNKVIRGSDKLEGAFPVISGDRGRKWRERAKRRQSQEDAQNPDESKTDLSEDQEIVVLSQSQAKAAEPGEKAPEEDGELVSEGVGNKVDLYV